MFALKEAPQLWQETAEVGFSALHSGHDLNLVCGVAGNSCPQLVQVVSLSAFSQWHASAQIFCKISTPFDIVDNLGDRDQARSRDRILIEST
jgi:hypothetical protein